MSIDPNKPQPDYQLPAVPNLQKSDGKEKTAAKTTAEIAFNKLVASLEKKEMDKITSKDIKELTFLIEQRIADDPAHPGIEKASKVIQKVMHRESKALNKSIRQKSIDKHEKNLKFFAKLAAENKEIFTQYVNNLDKKSVSQMKRYEIDPLLSMLKFKRTETPNEQTHLADDLVRKIMEREKMSFNHSYFPSSRSQHDENMDDIQDWMATKNVLGGTFAAKLDDYSKRLNKLSKKLSKKAVDQITDAEVKEFISLAKGEFDIYVRMESALASEIRERATQKGKTPDSDPREAASKLMKSEHPLGFSQQSVREIAQTKILLREEMELSRSYFQSSIDKHNKNIELLKKRRPRDLSV